MLGLAIWGGMGVVIGFLLGVSPIGDWVVHLVAGL